MVSNRDIVSESLLKEERGNISEEKLASHFCLQLPGWCPCLNCRDFDRPPALQKIGCNKNMPLSLKRKASRSPEESCEKACKRSTSRFTDPEGSTEAAADENHVERFQFDCNANELETFKEGECPENTTKSNNWALRNFMLGEWRVMRNTQNTSVQKMCLKTRERLVTGYASLCVKLEELMDKDTHP